jgi:hypothetical protein
VEDPEDAPWSVYLVDEKVLWEPPQGLISQWTRAGNGYEGRTPNAHEEVNTVGGYREIVEALELVNGCRSFLNWEPAR